MFHLQLSVASALLSTYPTQHPGFTHSKTVSHSHTKPDMKLDFYSHDA